MKEAFGDIWDLARNNYGDAIVITTNGFVKKDGRAVMGRGIALEATQRYKSLPLRLGKKITDEGNHVHHWDKGHLDHRFTIITFPVKHNWYEKADILLVNQSLLELETLADDLGLESIWMPRPGCGNGRLKWSDVKPMMTWLDDRFWVCHK